MEGPQRISQHSKAEQPASWSAAKPSDETVKESGRPLVGKYATQVDTSNSKKKPGILKSILLSPYTAGKKLFSRKTTHKMHGAMTDFLTQVKILHKKDETSVRPGSHRKYFTPLLKITPPEGLTKIQQKEYIDAFQTVQNQLKTVLKKQMPNASDELIQKKLEKFNIKIDVINKKVEVNEKVRLLAMDGGGIRGVGVAKILSAMEHSMGQPVHEVFDTVVGTSTGGLLAMLMTVPKGNGEIMSADEAISVYEDHAKEIFSHSRKKNFLGMKYHGVVAAKYKSTGIKSTISQKLGERTKVSKAVIPMGVVTNDKSNNAPILLNSKEAQNYKGSRSDQTVTKFARATTSAPTFFTGTRIKVANDDYLSEHTESPSKLEKLSRRRTIKPGQKIDSKKIKMPQYERKTIEVEDGGTVANNPTLKGLELMREVQGEKEKQFTKALKRNKDFKGWSIKYTHDEKVISLGTGSLTGTTENPNVSSGKNAGLLQLGKRIMADRKDLFGMEQSSWQGHDQMMQEFGEDNPKGHYHRAQFKVNKHQLKNMDDDSKANIEGLKKAASEYTQSDEFLYMMAGILSHMVPGNGHAINPHKDTPPSPAPEE